MKRTYIMAALSALPLPAIGATPLDLTGMPAHFHVARGQSIQRAIQTARFHARVDALRAAAGAPVTPAGALTKSTQPALVAGAVVSATLTVGQAGSIPAVQVQYKTGPAGLVGLALTFVSPSGNESLTVSYYPQDLSTHRTVTVEQPGSVPYYSQPGQWQLVSGFIEDYAGNFVSYDQTQLAALFQAPYITVINNGPVDITPPTVTSGQILTPTVSLSSPVPVFEANLTGSDDVSGLYEPFVGILPPGGSYSQVDDAPMPFPLLSGTGTAYSTLFAGQPTGAWSIAFYAFCDLVGNCFTDTSAADIQSLFGTTTFKVKN